MDGGGDDYLLVYSMFQNGVFQVLRWNMASGAFDFQTVASDVTDFGVDRNYPGSTNAQRVFATYQKPQAVRKCIRPEVQQEVMDLIG